MMYAWDSLDDYGTLLQGYCRGRPSVYFGRADLDKAMLFKNKSLGQDEEGEGRQDGIKG